MAVVDNRGDSRPPPSRQKQIHLFTPGIPWYRDLRVLRLISQLVFAVGFIGAIAFLGNNLTRNLRASNLAIDFNTYKSPFTVAIPEGISATSTWSWTQNVDTIWAITRFGWFMLFFVLFFMIVRRYRTSDWRMGPSGAAALFGLAGLFMPTQYDQLPGDISDVLNISGGFGDVVNIVLWLAIVAAAVYATYIQTRGNEETLLGLAAATVPFVIAVIYRPARIDGWLDNSFLGEIIEDSIIIPHQLTAILALAIWLIPVVATLYICFRLYVAEKAEANFLIWMAVLVGAIAYIYPLEAATQYNYLRVQEYLTGGTVTRAFITGIFNTLRVVLASLVACTVLGIMVGIGLLSRNWLVRNTSRVFVEIFRNTPLLIQLLFIHRTLTLLLPSPRESIRSPIDIGEADAVQNVFFFNARGLYYPAIGTTEDFVYFIVPVLIALVAAFFIRRWRLRVQELTGEPAYLFRYLAPTLIGSIIIGVVLSNIAGGSAFTIAYPALPEGARNVEGGAVISVAFVALFLGLTLYTAAFVAEIVRAGIQAVPYGQIEAARAQGLRGSQVLSLVVLPQALRLIIPPLGNQYVNLGKNSSLGLAVTYVETFRIAQLANNEKGQAVAYFVGLMVLYLSLSLLFSLLTNLINRLTQVKSR